MKFCNLSQLFAVGRPADLSVCSRNGEAISFAQFAADVAWNAHRISGTNCRRALLSTQDIYWGAVGLLAVVAAGADVVFMPNDLASTRARIGATCDIIVADDLELIGGGGLQLSSGSAATLAALPQVGNLNENASITFHTSGSTGAAKQVVKSLHHLSQEAAAIEALLGGIVPLSARIEGTVPHQHAYGMAFRLIWPLATGRTFAAATHFHLETCLSAVDAETMLVTSPAHLTRLEGLPRQPVGRVPCLVLSAGAPLPQAAVQSCADVLGVAPFEIFGSTETGAIAGRQRGHSEPDWTALPGVQIGRTEAGLLSARAEYIPGSVHTTSDKIELEPNGRFRFLGRSDDIVKIEGKRVSLMAVERALTGAELVAQAATVVLPGQSVGRSERLAAVVVLSPIGNKLRQDIGALLFTRALQAALRDSLEPAAVPRLWRLVDRLPDGALGKRRATDLVALFDQPATKE